MSDSIKERNKLNELSGKNWIKFTKSWFIQKSRQRDKTKIQHPASFPENLIEEFIMFFTKEGETVLDPFLGTGSTLIACNNTLRKGVGVELSKKYHKIAQDRISENSEFSKIQEDQCGEIQLALHGDSRNLDSILQEQGIKEIDFCITSPPYWNQLKRSNQRQAKRKENGLDTVYSQNDKNDLGNIDDYHRFINEQKLVFDKVYDLMKGSGYLVVITNNVFFNGRLYPLAFDTAISLTNQTNGGNWVLKDEKIWCQDDKSLLPLGIYSAWVGNRHHQYCLIFRKE